MSSEKLDSTAGGKKRDPDFINAESALKRAARKARQRAQQAGQRAGRKARDNPLQKALPLGLLYGGLTVSDIRNKMVSVRRNELLADLFQRSHRIEKWGRGIKMIHGH